MTSAEMLTRMRTLLDDQFSAFWTDNDIYRALADGQRAVIDLVLAQWNMVRAVNPYAPLPQILRSLFTTTTGTITTNLPADFLAPVAVYTSTGAAYERPDGVKRGTDKFNTYSISSSSQPYYSFSGTQLVWETAVAWTMEYIKIPSDIGSAQEPTIPAFTHYEIVKYAFAEMLKKDDKINEAQVIYNEFLQSVLELSKI